MKRLLERDIHLAMIKTLANMLSVARLKLTLRTGFNEGEENPTKIEAEVREIAERELKEKA